MSYHDSYPEPPRAENIPLTPENEALRLSILSGLESAISSDFAHTFEVTDTSDRKEDDWFRLPYPKFLARAAIMKLNGFDAPTDQAATDTETDPLFSIAIEARAHQLDIEKATDMTPEEVEELGFV